MEKPEHLIPHKFVFHRIHQSIQLRPHMANSGADTVPNSSPNINIREPYANNAAYVWLESSFTVRFHVEQSVRQECTLSPFLFNLYRKWVTGKALDN